MGTSDSLKNIITFQSYFFKLLIVKLHAMEGSTTFRSGIFRFKRYNQPSGVRYPHKLAFFDERFKY